MTREIEKEFIEELRNRTKMRRLEWRRLPDTYNKLIPNIDYDKSYLAELGEASVALVRNIDGFLKCYICQSGNTTLIGQHCSAELNGLYKYATDRVYPTVETFVQDVISGVL